MRLISRIYIAYTYTHYPFPQYIEMRFNSRMLRITSLVLNTFIGLIYSGLCLFAPTLALASVTPLSVDNNIVILGIVCTLYSTIVSCGA